MIILICILSGYIIGRIHEYRKKRVQCVNCGSFKTHISSGGFGSVKGSSCNFAVKHFESHDCSKCGNSTIINMTLLK